MFFGIIIRKYHSDCNSCIRSLIPWETQDHLVRLAPGCWKEKKQLKKETPAESKKNKNAAKTKQQRSAWAILIKIHLLVITIGIRRSRNTPFIPTIGTRRNRRDTPLHNYNWNSTKSSRYTFT